MIRGNCNHSRVFNHRYVMSRLGAGQIVAKLKFVCKCGARRYRLRIVDISLDEQEPLRMQHFRAVYKKFQD
jgi:hypothetical protein